MADLDKLEAADIKAIIWKHWNNKNGQTLEERFTSMADEIVQAPTTPADPRPDLLEALREAREALERVKSLLSYAAQDVSSEAVAQSNRNVAWHTARQALAKIDAVMGEAG